jgi:hypothetical protein
MCGGRWRKAIDQRLVACAGQGCFQQQTLKAARSPHYSMQATLTHQMGSWRAMLLRTQELTPLAVPLTDQA